MRTSISNYVTFNKWTGKIYKISSVPSDDAIIIKHPIIQDMADDKRSLESGYIGYNSETKQYEAYEIKGIIHLPLEEENWTEITSDDISLPDVALNLYTNNKLLEIVINYSAVKTWYNSRMKEFFSFVKGPTFIFEIRKNKNNRVLKHIEINPDKFLETFQTTIDLSDISSFNNIKIFTRRLFQTYFLNVQLNKFFEETDQIKKFNKVKNIYSKKIEYNMVISKTTKEKTIFIKNNITNPNLYHISNQLKFYITDKDPNELYDIVTIDIQDLFSKKSIVKSLNCNIDGKIIWCDNKNLNVLLDEKVINI